MQATALRSIELGVPDLDASTAFYQDAWGLELVDRADGAHYLRGGGPEHHIVVLRRSDEPALQRANLAAADRAAVDALYDRVRRAGGTPLHEPRETGEPGGGYGFAFTDIEGRELRVLAEVEQHVTLEPLAPRPYKLSHVVYNCTDTDASTAFFRDGLGFRLRDQTRMMDFMGCNADHHSIALTRLSNTSLNHVAYEVPNIDAVMRGSGRLKRNGYRLEWGVGRHGPGNNVFAYFIDPSDFAIEYTAEVQQIVDATYRVGKPEDWNRGSNNADAWGLADPPSERFHHVTSGPAKVHA